MKAGDWNKIAREYHKYIISPFQKGVSNPLLSKLKKIKNSQNKIIADIGCGRGDTLKFLSSNFKEVYAIDFSKEMIAIAKEKNSFCEQNISSKQNIFSKQDISSKQSNIQYYVKDMKNLSNFKNRFDVIISVNSIIMPSIKDIKKSLREIHHSLKRNGEFYGIFPSMDSILYESFLIFEEQFKKIKNEKKALKKTRRILERNKYDFIKGTYNDQGEEQKFYYDFEIKLRLQEAGFKEITISKVLYPWGECTGDFIDFPGKPKMWDWFVSAKS